MNKKKRLEIESICATIGKPCLKKPIDDFKDEPDDFCFDCPIWLINFLVPIYPFTMEDKWRNENIRWLKLIKEMENDKKK